MAKVSKWGNSLAVRLPKKVVDALNLKDGDEVNIGFGEGATPTFEVRRTEESEAERAEQAIKALRKFRGRMPAGFKFDREEANRRD